MDERSCLVRISILSIWKDWIESRRSYSEKEREQRLSQISIDISQILSWEQNIEPTDKKREWCHTCKYWDGVGDGGISWGMNGCGYCRHGPPTAGCKNQVSAFPITSEYEWCWKWRKIDDDCYIGGF